MKLGRIYWTNIPRNSSFTVKILNESFQSSYLKSSHKQEFLDYLNQFFLYKLITLLYSISFLQQVIANIFSQISSNLFFQLKTT